VTPVPPSVEINHALLFSIGTGLWGIALAVMVVLDLAGIYQARVWIWVCGAGLILGIAAIIYSKFSWRARQPSAQINRDER
jgi:hypothetical protein